MKNLVNEKWLKGEACLGAISHMLSPVAVEAMGAAGMDFVLLDMEHGPINFESLAACITAADAANITPMVRVSDVTRPSILRELDLGANGVIVPCLENVEQVKALIQHAKFKPLGNRGYCMTRDGKWGFGEIYAKGLDGYMDQCNKQTLLIPQWETVGCLENIEEIAALEGIDGILVGPYDLSLALGVAGPFSHPDFICAVDRILSACKANNKISMIFVNDEQAMKSRLGQGFDCILYGIDVVSLISFYSSIKEKFDASV